MDYMMKKDIFIFDQNMGVTVPAHFLKNGGCDVIQMSF